MKRIYISGPITDNPKWRDDFIEADRFLRKKYDCKVINPYKISLKLERECRGLYGRLPTYDEYLTRDLFAMRKADAIYLLKGWEQSKGALREKEVAEKWGLEVIYAAEENGKESG